MFSGFMPLSVTGGDYNTGFNIKDYNNLETKHNKKGENSFDIGAWYGNPHEDYSELIRTPVNNNPIVTEMTDDPGGDSVTVSLYGTVAYIGPVLKYWEAEKGWYTVDIKYTPYGTWHNILDTSKNSVDESIISFTSGSLNKQDYSTKKYDLVTGMKDIVVSGFEIISKTLDPVEFKIKGPQTGIIRVQQHTTFYGTVFQEESWITSEDYALLISGKGDVDILSEQTRYIAGEDTVKFKVDTGFSGKTQGGSYTSKGWELKVYDNHGNLKKTWKLDDDKTNTRYDSSGNKLDYKIPADAVSSTESHRWSVVLTNTLFYQDDEYFFGVTREEVASAPGIKKPVFGKDSYNMGDTVAITLEGIPNSEGLNTVNGFLVNIMYGQDGNDYILDYHGKYVYATGNKATINVDAAKGDTYITVEAWAFDKPEDSGGIMSEKATGQVWIKDKEHEPVIHNFMVYVIVAIILLIGVVIAYLWPIGGPVGKILVFIIFVFIAVIYYLMDAGLI